MITWSNDKIIINFNDKIILSLDKICLYFFLLFRGAAVMVEWGHGVQLQCYTALIGMFLFELKLIIYTFRRALKNSTVLHNPANLHVLYSMPTLN